MIGAYMGFEIIRLLYPSFLLALGVALAATAVLGIVVELLAFHFLRNAPHATSLLVTIGISILLVNLAQKIWGPETQSIPFGLINRLGNFEIEIAGVYITFLQIAVLGVTVLLMLALYFVINRTKLGMVIRATAQDYEAAYAMGVNVDRIYMAAFAIGSRGAYRGIGGGPLSMDRLRHEVTMDDQPLDLTPKEFQLLEFFLLHPEEVVRRTTLLEKVWDMHFDPESNVVDVHVGNLRRKLAASSGGNLISTVRGVGFCLRALNAAATRSA